MRALAQLVALPQGPLVPEPVAPQALVPEALPVPSEHVVPVTEAPSAPNDSAIFATQHPARILLVEDQPMNQKLANMMLKRLGYHDVDLAENGREAVDLAQRNNYDVILMDLQMPVMGGHDAAREIRGNFLLKRQPAIIAVTGYALSGVRDSCLEAGMTDFVSKPVSLDMLRDVLSRAVHRTGGLALQN